VLVVDDMDDVAESLAELLGIWGHKTRVAHDGRSALETVRVFHPDVVLLDIGMPGMDGYEVARRLRVEHGQRTLLVALTGYGQTQDREAARAAGFDAHLVKPVDLDALNELLARGSCS
jgi:CheY-like chemotaxis protein